MTISIALSALEFQVSSIIREETLRMGSWDTGHDQNEGYVVAIHGPRPRPADRALLSTLGDTELPRAMDAEVAYLRGFCGSLKDIIKQLRALHDSSQGRAEGLEIRSRAVKNGQGLTKLPNELIAHILGYSLCPSQTNDSTMDGTTPRAVTLEKDVLALSHVNRQFLYVARSTPVLWTTITRLYPCSMVEAFLERSGACGFQVIQADKKSRKIQQVIQLFGRALQALCRNAHRLEALVIRTHELEQQELIQEMILNRKHLHFPRLKQLDVLRPFAEDYVQDIDAGTPPYGTLLGTRFPRLRILGVQDTMLGLCAVKTLTSVYISGLPGNVDPDVQAPFDVGDLLGALGELPALESFSLESNYDLDFPVSYHDQASPPLALPTLRHLQLQASTEASMLIVENILRYVSFPGLEILILDLSTPYEEDEEEFNSVTAIIDALGRDHHSFSQLHTLHLSRLVRSNVFRYDPHEFAGDQKMLSLMPALRNISLSHTIPGNTMRLLGDSSMLVPSDRILSHLETISLYSCDRLRCLDILRAIRSRQRSSIATPIKKLVVKNCAKINQNDYDTLAAAMMGYGSLEVDYYEAIVGK